MKKTPVLGITMGDAAGIGPEIIVGAWSKIVREAPCVVFGHPEIFRRAALLCRVDADIVEITERDLSAPPCSSFRIPCLRCGDDNVVKVIPGMVDAWAGESAYQAVVRAVDLAKAKKIGGIVTAPLNKGALNLAGHHYPGHTELLAERCGVDDFAMMLYLGAGENIVSPYGLAVVHVTLHTAMRNIFDLIDGNSVLAKAKLADQFMSRIIGRSDHRPRIGVCSLNPHAGEEGLFGSEEMQIIRPAIEQGISEGLSLWGPFPADTIMVRAKEGEYDAVVAMFHDQGHIALKLLGMHRAVNVTLGLPIVRTSVAHGTAFDKAWKGIAEIGSMVEAVRVAAKLC